MRGLARTALGLLGLGGTVLAGCAAPGSVAGTACTVTPYISPATVTLDHTASPAANSVQFTTGYEYSGPCPETNVIPEYFWAVSDTTDASITSPGGKASCLAAASEPITVSSLLSTYSVANGPGFVSSGLPSATLTCK